MSEVIEISFDSLGLTKPLEKMTAKELRALCVAKLPQVTGASGMSKEDLVSTIKELFGISAEEGSANPYKDQISAIKREIKAKRVEKAEAASRRDRDLARRRINKLKKRTRRLAKSA